MGDRSAHDPARPARRAQTVGERARGFLNGIFYVLWTGCQWKALAKGCCRERARCTDYAGAFWNWDGTLERIHHALYVAQREEEGREASPTVASHQLADREGRSKRGSWLDPSGYDAGKKFEVQSGTSWSTRWVSC